MSIAHYTIYPKSLVIIPRFSISQQRSVPLEPKSYSGIHVARKDKYKQENKGKCQAIRIISTGVHEALIINSKYRCQH